MTKNKSKNKVLDLDVSHVKDVETIFTDLTVINLNQETVKIKLAVKDTDSQKADVSHIVVMTIPHFLRFTEICKKVSQEILSANSGDI